MASMFTPAQMSQMFGDVGWNRGEQNPPPPQPPSLGQALMAGRGGTGDAPMGAGMGMPTYAQGGYVDAPGYYQQGGSSYRPNYDPNAPRTAPQPIPLPIRPPVPGEMPLDAFARRYHPADYERHLQPPRTMLPVPTDEQIRAAAQSRSPTMQDLSLQKGPRDWPGFNRERFQNFLQNQPPSTNIEDRRNEVLPQELLLNPPPPAVNRDAPFPSRGYQRGGPVRLQRGGLGIPQMNMMASQAHYGAINMRPAIGRPPGVHLMGSSSVPGRTDRIPMRAKAGSYVLPADVVSGLGQGNTHAGARMWGQAIMASVPGAGTMGALRRGTMPKAPQPSFGRMMGRVPSPGRGLGFADGGDVGEEYVPIITAGGEVLIDPEVVEALGNGSEMLGKRKLAESVLRVRKQTIEHLKTLPRPVK